MSGIPSRDSDAASNTPLVPAKRWSKQEASIEAVRVKNVATRARGSSHPKAKLTEEQVREIILDRRGYREIAGAYGVSPATVSNIKTGKTWNHVQP